MPSELRVDLNGTPYRVTSEDVVAIWARLTNKDRSELAKQLEPAPRRGRPSGDGTFDLKRAENLRKQGKTYADIAAELGCSSRTIIRKLKAGCSVSR